MVIGNGLIANALREYEKNDDIIIFASGVSNSMTNDRDAFEREKMLLLSFKDYGKKIIYFSTCSIFDKTLLESEYVLHKIQMEKLIQDNFDSYLIMRLPTVVGKNNNPFVFFNFIKNKLSQSEEVCVYKFSTRYLLAIDDISLMLESLLMHGLNRTKINVAFNNKASVADIVTFMKTLIQSSSEIVYLDKGYDLEIDNSDFLSILSSQKKSYLSYDYRHIINKYL